MSAELHVIDVGHGNCAVAVDDDWAIMVDAAASVAVVDTIEHLELDRLDAIVISHRDYDHAGGLVSLLARKQLAIGAIYVGADAAKNPTAPQTATLLAALDDAKRDGRCLVSRDLDDASSSGILSGSGVSVEVLAPTFATAMTGPKGKSPVGPTMTSNTVSAVLRVTLDDGMRVLLAGDIDDASLLELTSKGTDLSADVLVFPHHGSHSTVADERSFAADVMRVVQPQRVLFSVGRGAKARPTREVLEGVFDVNPEAEIGCTQLSTGCLMTDASLPSELAHLGALPAAGRLGCSSCIGSVTIGGAGLAAPDPEAHQSYLRATAETPMCFTVRPTK